MSAIVLPYRRAEDVDAVCADVRSGRGALVLLTDTTPALLLLGGPKGMPWWPFYGRTPVPFLELRALDGSTLAEASANRAFPAGLDEIAAKAEPLVGSGAPSVRALLAAILATTETMRFRVPVVGEYVVEEGEPSFAAWASCLPLGVLQRCLDRSRRSRAA